MIKGVVSESIQSESDGTRWIKKQSQVQVVSRHGGVMITYSEVLYLGSKNFPFHDCNWIVLVKVTTLQLRKNLFLQNVLEHVIDRKSVV